MAATYGFQAELRYILESSEGGGVPDSGGEVLKLLSDSLAQCSLSVNTNTEGLRDLGSADLVGYVQGVTEFTLTTRSRLQNVAAVYTFLQDLCTRQSNGRLKTFALELNTASDATTEAFYTIAGAKPDEVLLDVDQDGLFVLEVTWRPLTVTRATSQPVLASTTRQSSIGQAYWPFTGAKFESPSGTALAYAVRKGGFRCRHNLEAIKNAGTTTVKTFAEGARDLAFVGDITVDDGGKALVDAAIAGTEADVIIFVGQSAGNPKITLGTTRLPDFEQSYDDQAAIVTASIERPAKTITFGSV